MRKETTITKVDTETNTITVDSEGLCRFQVGMSVEITGRLKWYQRLLIWLYEKTI